MKQALLLAIVSLIIPPMMAAQGTDTCRGNDCPFVAYVGSDPTGNVCGNSPQVTVYNGTIYTCKSGVMASSPGPTGPTGPIGPTGPQGASGRFRRNWSMWVRVDQLEQRGATGPTGATGAQASLGAAGTNGTNGTVIPTGMISFIASGTCPAGWTEVTTMIGRYIMGTTAANGGVGGTGGSTSYTPAGTNAAPTVGTLTAASQTFTGTPGTVPAQTFTGNAGTVPAETFTGSSANTSAVTAGTPAGTNGATATTGNCASTAIAAGTGSLNACKTTAPNLTVPAETFTGSQLATHLHTVTATGTNSTAAFTPAGTNSTAAFTPAGTNGTSSVTGTLVAGAFSGTPATIQPPYIELIPCSKN